MRAPLILSALLVAGCASGSTSWSYEGIPVTVPGAYGVTPMMKTMEYTWRPPALADTSQVQRDIEICQAASRTTLGSMMFGGHPPLRRFEDCFERLGYVMTGKKAAGEPVASQSARVEARSPARWEGDTARRCFPAART